MRSLLLMFLLLSGLRQSVAQGDHVVVRPRESSEVLTNPGMGFTTFQRFNGDPLNPRLTWSEAGPVTQLTAAVTKPDFPDTTISYCRWYWQVLEPEHGRYRWDIIDLALKEARAHGQRLALRLMPYDDEGRAPLPAWYRASGAARANKDSDKDGKIWQPNFGDPLYLKYWGEFVAEFGKRYDGNPSIDTVDISSVGYWGEGWSPYMPPFADQKNLIDIWINALPHTQLLMNFDEPQALAYGTSKGAGWRLDCLGDMRLASADHYFEPEMLDIYPQQVVRAGIQEVWRSRPVSLETCGTPSSWKDSGFDVSYILDQALRWHVTSVNLKSSPIPAEWKPQFEAFSKQMGYRFLLRRLEYPQAASPGAMVPIHMWWLNAGVAPVYREYTIALQLQSAARSVVLPVSAKLTEWLPGDAVVDQSLYLPEDLPSGEYTLSVGILDPGSQTPAIRLAIEGRRPDGWYPMGTIRITSPSGAS